jgi:hypothetical protein
MLLVGFPYPRVICANLSQLKSVFSYFVDSIADGVWPFPTHPVGLWSLSESSPGTLFFNEAH